MAEQAIPIPMERATWKGRMDLSRVYTKTSKGILEGNAKSRDLTREHGRVLTLIDGKSSVSDLLEKNSRLSESRLATILDELAEFGMIRQLNGALAVDDLGFSSTIIVDESNTQAFFEAQVHLERELRRAEDHEVRAKEQDRAALLSEVKADIEAEAEAIKRELAERNAREAKAKEQAQVKAQEVAQREAEEQLRRKAEAKAQAAAEKARQAREEAEAHAKAVAEHTRKQLEAEAKARAEAEARAKALEAEVFARAEVARIAKQEAAQRKQAEADAKARMEAEKKAREQAEKQALAAEKACEAAERKARKEAEENARLAKEAEVKANARRELEAKLQAEEEAQRRAEMEARLHEMEQGKRRAEEEAQALAKALDEARIATELETRVKRRMEARAREDEGTRQRAEAETRAKLEEESRLRQEAEARARGEAEARRLAEEAKIKAEQDAQAQLEAERLARKEAEARAIAEAEAQRQAEAARLAAEQRAEEERRMREQAEAKAQEQAARRQAEAEAEQRRIDEAEALVAEQARLAAEQRAEEERLAHEEAEREARAIAEARAKAEEEAQRRADEERIRVEAEARAVAEAEEAVRLEAEAVKRQLEEQQRAEEAARQQEAERAVAEAAESKSRALAEARERAEAEARARDDARRQAREAAEAAARTEAEEALRRVEEATRSEEAEEAHLRDEAQARAMAAAQGAAVFPFLTARKRARIRFNKKLIKPAVYGVLGFLLFALAVIHLISFNFYIPIMEQQLTESIGQRVVVKDIRFSVYPAPHLKLEGLAIGDLADVRVGTARLFPAFSSWFSEEKVIRRIELEAVALSEDSVSALSVWSQYQAQAAPVQFEQIWVKDAKLANRLLDLFAFDADVKMDHGRFAKAQIKSTDQRITINFTPQADTLAIQLAATHSVLPLEPRIQFDELKITAIARPGSMTLSHIEGQLYGGALSGNARVEWRDGWLFTSDLGLRQVAIEPVLTLFTRNMKASGALEAKIRLTTKSTALETLFNAPQVQATFRVRDGELSGVDLVRAIQSARSNGNIGGKTYFNELSGYLQLANGRYQYRQLKLLTGMMSANGNLEFSAERSLSGNLVGELRTRAMVLRTPFTLGGTLATPTLKVASPPQRPAPVKAIQEEQ
ncbi:MAG: AsmA family protein [Burkholderiales bacterium]|nr:AsmA family protein [Burkholderiales bacterium]